LLSCVQVWSSQIWCSAASNVSVSEELQDVHSPALVRSFAYQINQPGFAEAFGCKANQPMGIAAQGSTKSCRIW